MSKLQKKTTVIEISFQSGQNIGGLFKKKSITSLSNFDKCIKHILSPEAV